MPKLKLKFKLPKEEAEANFALKGGDYFAVIHNLDQRLRDITKYGNNPFIGRTAIEQEVLLAEQIREYLRDQNINEIFN
jgi:hypothetical protein